MEPTAAAADEAVAADAAAVAAAPDDPGAGEGAEGGAAANAAAEAPPEGPDHDGAVTPTPIPEEAAEAAANGEDNDEDDDDLFADDKSDDGPAAPAASEAQPRDEETSPPLSHESSSVSAGASSETPASPPPSDSQSSQPNGGGDTASAAAADGIAAIPRKAPAAPTSPPSPRASSLAAFRFDPALIIPKTVTASIMSGALAGLIRSLPVRLANDALQEYDEAIEAKGGAIRNRGAYLHGVVKRYVSVQDRARAEGGGPAGAAALPMGEALTPAVEARLERLVASGFCPRDEMTDKVRTKIRMLSERDALSALDELLTVDRASIRNFGSYFMGILNRYMRGDTSSKSRSSPQQPGPHDRQRGGRDRDRLYRDSASGPERDRSRDHYGPMSEPPHLPPFPQYGGPPPPMQPPPYDNRQPAYPPQHAPPQHPPPQQQPPQWQQPMNHQPPSSMPTHRPMMPANQGGMPGNVDGTAYMPPQVQQPPYAMQFSSSNATTNNPMFLSQGYAQQSPQLQASLPPQPGPPLGGGGYFQPTMGGQQPQQAPQSQYGAQSQMNPSLPPGGYQQQQQLGFGAAGIAAGMSGPYNPPSGTWQQPPPLSNPQQSQVPLDILGLADKAASVVQALSAQNKMMQHQPAPVSNFQLPPTQQQPMASQYPQYGGTAPNALPPLPPQGMQQPPPQFHAPPPSRPNVNEPFKRRAQARLDELPFAVQYAVQNIQSSRMVEGPLDAGMLGMVADLPEPLALGAIQRFAAMDKSTVRNKTAYLAGLLRRELEKINRR